MIKNAFKNLGGYNDFPNNWREIDVTEFGKTMNYYKFIASEFRQMVSEDYTSPSVSATLFVYHDQTGIAIDRNGRTYAFGCDHEMEETKWDSEKFGTRFNCNTAYKCKKCGYTKVIDSSD